MNIVLVFHQGQMTSRKTLCSCRTDKCRCPTVVSCTISMCKLKLLIYWYAGALIYVRQP